MRTTLYLVPGPWPGRLFLSARPRGGDWLEDEFRDLSASGVHTVACLLTAEEMHDLDLETEPAVARQQGMTFLQCPIPDREPPTRDLPFTELVEDLDRRLAAGESVVIHCRQGIGRTGLAAAALLIAHGFDADRATAFISQVRGIPVPETEVQRQWLHRYAAAFAAAR
ncbi:MAG: dual specificity protein phosphatase family protein [Acidobacteria bacterium]|nr:dual specificity protein phosphatase family protein [Acidobacteriota bacterium]